MTVSPRPLMEDDYSAELCWPLDAGRLGPVPPMVTVAARPPAPLVLSDSATAILTLAAAHDGVSPSALVTRLVCQHAERVGLSVLLDSGDLVAVPEFDRVEVARPTRLSRDGPMQTAPP